MQLGVISCARMKLTYTGLKTVNTRAAGYYRDRKLNLPAVRWKAHFAMDIQMTMSKARFGL